MSLITISLEFAGRNRVITIDPDKGTASMSNDVGLPVSAPPACDWQMSQIAYIAWGIKSGGKNGAPWADRQDKNVRKHLDWWFGYLSPAGTPFDLATLKLSQVEEGIAALRALDGKGEPSYAAATVRHRTAQLRAFVNWCRKREHLTGDPLRALTVPGGKSSKRLRALTMAEFWRLYNAAPLHRQHVYLFAVQTAFRQNEIRSLTFMDCHKAKLCVQLRAEHEKTRTERWFPLTEKLFGVLDWAQGYRGDTDPAMFKFTTNPIREFKKDCKKAGIPLVTDEGSIDFHGLRRTAITWFEEAGATDAQVRAFGRHQSHDTSHRYRKATCDQLREVMMKVETELYKQRPPDGGPGYPHGDLNPGLQAENPQTALHDPNTLLNTLAHLVLSFYNAPADRRAAAISLLTTKGKP